MKWNGKCFPSAYSRTRLTNAATKSAACASYFCGEEGKNKTYEEKHKNTDVTPTLRSSFDDSSASAVCTRNPSTLFNVPFCADGGISSCNSGIYTGQNKRGRRRKDYFTYGDGGRMRLYTLTTERLHVCYCKLKSTTLKKKKDEALNRCCCALY